MKAFPCACVLDASVGIKLFLAEEHSEAVQCFFERAEADRENSIHIPDLFFVECANILWKKVRRGEYPETDASENLTDLQTLGLPCTPTSRLVGRALEIACHCGTTVYDASYAALAEQLDLPLLTADTRLAALLSPAGIKTVTLQALTKSD